MVESFSRPQKRRSCRSREQQLSGTEQQERSEEFTQHRIRSRPGEPRSEVRANQQPHCHDRRISPIHLLALQVPQHAEQAHRQEQRGELRAVRGVLRQFGQHHETGDDDDRPTHTEQSRYDSRDQPENRHHDPDHRVSSGCPQAPPPGVSMRRMSPAARRSETLDGNGEPFNTLAPGRSEEHTSELQSPCNLVCRLLLEKKKIVTITLPRTNLNPRSAPTMPVTISKWLSCSTCTPAATRATWFSYCGGYRLSPRALMCCA